MAEEITKNESMNFIHTFITQDIAPGGQFEGQTVHTRFPPGAERLSAYRPLQSPLHRFWHCRKVWRTLQFAYG